MEQNRTSQDIAGLLQEALEVARAQRAPVQIRGGGSKDFYGENASGDILNVSGHRGVVNYAPSELVLTVRAGTPLREIDAVLATEQQMLGFEPPAFARQATIGGTLACNFSGPRRAFAGSARDFLLGCRILNGKAEQLHFGGEVMKNVAGYDISRLMCGALGTLGVLLEVSLKVLPKAEAEITLQLEMDAGAALSKVHQLARQPLPISATCFDGQTLQVRLSGSAGAVQAGQRTIGGEVLAAGEQFWQQLKEQRGAFFTQDKPLWRLSLASNAPILTLPGATLYEWNGALRWLYSDAPGEQIRTVVAKLGGHATCFRRAGSSAPVFQPLGASLSAIHRQLKRSFDPDLILNPGRLYPDW